MNEVDVTADYQSDSCWVWGTRFQSGGRGSRASSKRLLASKLLPTGSATGAAKTAQAEATTQKSAENFMRG